MAPKVSALKDEYDEEINFVFLNVDNQKWDNYIRKFNVNGIPQVNLFDRKGNLISTYIGKQEEITIKDSLNQLKGAAKSSGDLINSEFSVIKENKNNAVNPRSHG
jgi:thioredoxin-like negative regulator of GroEL